MTRLRVVVVILGVLFAAFVWPTLYRYEHVANWQLLVRINRITGSVDLLDLNEGWMPLRPAPRKQD